MHRTWLGLGFVVAMIACKKDAPPPASYQYELALDGNQPAIEIQVNGTAIGKLGKVTIPRETLLGDPATRIEMMVATTCGPQGVRLQPKLAPSGRPEAEERKSYGATSRIFMNLTASAATPLAPTIDVYLDNVVDQSKAAGKGKPSKVRIGSLDIEVPHNGDRVEKVRIGACDTARTIEIDGKPVGTAPELTASQALLVAVQPDRCYAHFIARYAEKGRENPAAGSEREILSVPGHVLAVPRVGYPFKAVPTTIEARRDSDPEYTSLGLWTCPGPAARR